MCRMTNIRELLNLRVPSILGPPFAPATLYPRSLYSILGLQSIEFTNDLLLACNFDKLN